MGAMIYDRELLSPGLWFSTGRVFGGVSRHRVFFCSQRLNLSNHPVQFYPYRMFTTTMHAGGGKEVKDGNGEKKHPLNSQHAVLLSNHIHN